MNPFATQVQQGVVKKQSAFTLIELIAIVLIISVIAAVASPRFSSGDATKVQTSRDDVLAALFFAQQVAMARANTTNPVRFIFSSGQISVEENGTPLRNGSITYPLNINSGVSISGSVSSPYSFDKLGRTAASTLTLSSGSNSAQIFLSASGYAYAP
jgi:MSHA pilin protein MshC